jgi:uncharacterized protein YegJ (DUF2314 family)
MHTFKIRRTQHIMNRKSWIALALMGILLSLLVACSKKDKVISIEDSDPEMNAAIAKARETLPQFWQVFDKPEHGETNFSIKVQITDKKGVEHFWTTKIEKRDGKIWGTINNDPDIVASVKFGERIAIPEADISDWLYMRNGKMVGNRTIVPLLKQMTQKDAEKMRKLMAEP